MCVRAFHNCLLICPLRIAASACSAIDELLAVEFQYSLRLIEPPLIRTRVGAIPRQLVHIIEEFNISPQRGELWEKYRVIPVATKRICKGARVGRVHAPFAAILRDGLEMNQFGQHRSRRSCPSPLAQDSRLPHLPPAPNNQES